MNFFKLSIRIYEIGPAIMPAQILVMVLVCKPVKNIRGFVQSHTNWFPAEE